MVWANAGLECETLTTNRLFLTLSDSPTAATRHRPSIANCEHTSVFTGRAAGRGVCEVGGLTPDHSNGDLGISALGMPKSGFSSVVGSACQSLRGFTKFYRATPISTEHHRAPSMAKRKKKKKKKLHQSSHIRMIRWTQPVSRAIGEHNEQAESTSVCSVQVGHKPGMRVTSSGHSAKQPPGRAQVESSKITTPVYEGESTVWSN